MRTFLISYDLGSPEGSYDYEKVIKYIESLEYWAKPLKSQFFVKTNKTKNEIIDKLISLTDSNDKIMFIDVTGDDWTTYGLSEKVVGWMKMYI